MSAKPITLVMIDDHVALRQGVELILRDNDLQALGAADDAEQGYSLVVDRKPDVAVIDIDLPGMSGTALTRRLVAEMPSLGVLLYTGLSDASRLKEAVDSGARGIALKAGPPEELVQAIRAVAAGESYVDPRLDQLVKPLVTAGADAAKPDDHRLSIVDRLLSLARHETGMDLAMVGEFSGPNEVIAFVNGDVEAFGMSVGTVTPLEATYSMKMVTGRIPPVIPDTRANDVTADLELTYEANIGAYIGAPVRFSDRRLYGVMSCLNRAQLPSLGERNLKLVELLAGHVAEELEFQELESRFGLSDDELASTRETRMSSMASVIMGQLTEAHAGGRLVSMPLYKVAALLSGHEQKPKTPLERFRSYYATKPTAR